MNNLIKYNYFQNNGILTYLKYFILKFINERIYFYLIYSIIHFLLIE